MKLVENACRNRGYVLSGYPRNYDDACNIFYIRPKKFDEEGNEIEEDEPELEEGEKKSFEGYIPDPDIFPAHVIQLKGTDEFLINRIKNLPETSIAGTHNNEADLLRRLKKYRIENNSEVAELSVSDYFK